MRVYLDNCCYNRPFDDQSQLKVHLETVAKLAVQTLMRDGSVEYAWSEVLDGEIGDSPFPDRQEKILPWRDGAVIRAAITPEIEARAEHLMRLGVKATDALHLACAESVRCDWFMTVDRGILSKVDHLGTMRVANPLSYVLEEMQ